MIDLRMSATKRKRRRKVPAFKGTFPMGMSLPRGRTFGERIAAAYREQMGRDANNDVPSSVREQFTFKARGR